ncbi:MAG TPA: hypothetical protein VEH49_00015 [Methylomirabilota bacterium]|nr:hypothetical protein [Methylomirabilota bacterium]
MNWKLIFGLSLLGLAMAFATVFFVPATVEPVCWLVVFVVYAYLIARARSSGQFLHGFLLGLVNCAWVIGAHMVFFERYLAKHPQEAAVMATMPLANSPRLLMALFSPVVGIISGIVIGLLAFLAGKFVKAPGTN